MDSMHELLRNRDFVEPPEIAIIKRFVEDNYHESAQISINNQGIMVKVHSSALANSLQLRLPEIQRLIGNSKRLSFRVG